jgi:hypothetical protein
MSSTVDSLAAVIATMRQGGVISAEFHPDGAVKSVMLGPDPNAGGTDSEPAAEGKSALREHARRLSFGQKVA